MSLLAFKRSEAALRVAVFPKCGKFELLLIAKGFSLQPWNGVVVLSALCCWLGEGPVQGISLCADFKSSERLICIQTLITKIADGLVSALPACAQLCTDRD